MCCRPPSLVPLLQYFAPCSWAFAGATYLLLLQSQRLLCLQFCQHRQELTQPSAPHMNALNLRLTVSTLSTATHSTPLSSNSLPTGANSCKEHCYLPCRWHPLLEKHWHGSSGGHRIQGSWTGHLNFFLQHFATFSMSQQLFSKPTQPFSKAPILPCFIARSLLRHTNTLSGCMNVCTTLFSPNHPTHLPAWGWLL